MCCTITESPILDVRNSFKSQGPNCDGLLISHMFYVSCKLIIMLFWNSWNPVTFSQSRWPVTLILIWSWSPGVVQRLLTAPFRDGLNEWMRMNFATCLCIWQIKYLYLYPLPLKIKVLDAGKWWVLMMYYYIITLLLLMH